MAFDSQVSLAITPLASLVDHAPRSNQISSTKAVQSFLVVQIDIHPYAIHASDKSSVVACVIDDSHDVHTYAR